MDYDLLGKRILSLVGGAENVAGVAHCATRLRFNLNDEGKADLEQLKKLDGVLGVVVKGGQTQIVIGPNVVRVYSVVSRLAGGEAAGAGNRAGTKSPAGGAVKQKPAARILDTVVGIFAPIIPAVTGAGMLKAVLSILVVCGLSKESQNYYIINFISDAVFYFLPVLLANSAAKKFNCNPYFAMAIAGVMIHPSFVSLVTAGEAVRLFGMPVYLYKYASSTIPIILVVWFMSYVERFAEKYSPQMIKVILKPLIVLLVVSPVALIVIGPLGAYCGDVVAAGINLLDKHVGFLVPMLTGALAPLLVAVGMHISLVPISSIQLADHGSETAMGPGWLASNIAQGGAAMAVALKTKSRKMKQLALSSGITALCGITEPVLYGVTMKLKRPLIAVIISGGAAGLYAGLSGLVRYSFGSPGIPTIAVFIGENPNNIIKALITMAIAFTASFVLTWVLGFEDEEDGDELAAAPAVSSPAPEAVYAPARGRIMELNEVKDEAFSSGSLGGGFAVDPAEGKVYAPFDGTVAMVFPTGHAVGLVSAAGTEAIIHVGIDTVNLNGAHFETHVNAGDAVKRGDLLLTFDLNAIKEKGYDTVIPLVITNAPGAGYSLKSRGNVDNSTIVLDLAKGV